jgi:VanZ family protein
MSDDLSRSLDRARWPLRIAYLLILLLATLTNLAPSLDAGAAAARAGDAFDVSLTPKDALDAVRNVVLFAGWGLVWMATAPAGATVRSLALAIVTGIAISIGVETAQLFSDVRRASPLDVLYNGGGAVIGAIVVVVAVRRLARHRSDRSFVGLPAALFAGGYGMVVLGEALIPLFRQDRVSVWGDPLSRFVFAVRAFEPASFGILPLSEIVLFVPAGFFLAAAIVEAGNGYRRAGLIAALAGSALIVVTEVVRGAASLAIPGGPILVHVASVSAGAAAAALLLPRIARRLRGAERPQLLFAVYAGIVALWNLRPYVPEADPSVWLAQLTGHWWMPMAFATARMDLFSVIDVTNGFFLLLPVGGLLAVWPFRRTGPWSSIVPGIVLAVVVEAFQVFVAGRTLALADMLIGGAGAWTGWVIVRRAGYPVRGEMLS